MSRRLSPVRQLCEGHAKVLVDTTKPFDIPLALVALHATPECMHWKVVGKLKKQAGRYTCVAPKESEFTAWPEWFFMFKSVTPKKRLFFYAEHQVRIGVQRFNRTVVRYYLS
jgi:hypothetical protein